MKIKNSNSELIPPATRLDTKIVTLLTIFIFWIKTRVSWNFWLVKVWMLKNSYWCRTWANLKYKSQLQQNRCKFCITRPSSLIFNHKLLIINPHNNLFTTNPSSQALDDKIFTTSPSPQALHHEPYATNPTPRTLHHEPYITGSSSYTIHFQTYTASSSKFAKRSSAEAMSGYRRSTNSMRVRLPKARLQSYRTSNGFEVLVSLNVVTSMARGSKLVNPLMRMSSHLSCWSVWNAQCVWIAKAFKLPTRLSCRRVSVADALELRLKSQLFQRTDAFE